MCAVVLMYSKGRPHMEMLLQCDGGHDFHVVHETHSVEFCVACVPLDSFSVSREAINAF